MEQSEKFKILLIGCGQMGKNHLRVIGESSLFSLIGVVDPEIYKSQKFINDKVAVYSNINQIQPDAFECAVIAAPSEEHFQLAKSLIALKKPFIVEKPLCISVAECKEIIKQKGNIPIAVSHVERFNPAIQKLREIVASDVIGKPIHFSFTRVGGYPHAVKPGNNVLIDLAIHDLDVFSLFVEKAKIKSSICHSTLVKDVCDTAEILVTSESNVSASIHANWVTPTKIRTVRVTGSRGVAFVDYMLQTCTVYGGNLLDNRHVPELNFKSLVDAYHNSDKIEFAVKKAEPLKVQLTEFAKLLKSEKSNCCTPEEAITSISLAEDAINRGK